MSQSGGGGGECCFKKKKPTNLTVSWFCTPLNHFKVLSSSREKQGRHTDVSEVFKNANYPDAFCDYSSECQQPKRSREFRMCVQADLSSCMQSRLTKKSPAQRQLTRFFSWSFHPNVTVWANKDWVSEMWLKAPEKKRVRRFLSRLNSQIHVVLKLKCLFRDYKRVKKTHL